EAQNRLFMARFTTATGYVALGLLALTLLIGPANLLLRKRNPVSSYLRRDVGMWTVIISVVHVVVGFQVHGPSPSPASLMPLLGFTVIAVLAGQAVGVRLWRRRYSRRGGYAHG